MTLEDASAVDTLTETSTLIPAWGYAVITDDSGAISVPETAIHLTVDGRIGNGLGNSGDTLVLKNSLGTVIDTVNYSDNWADSGADGTGSSLELVDPSSDNNDSSNWVASTPANDYGTPGVRNSTFRFTWTGSTSSNWNVSSNWSPGVGYPQNAEDNVVIADVATAPVLNDDVEVNDLTINSGGVLDVSGDNHTLTIFGNWVNDGTFIAQQGEVRFASDETQQLDSGGTGDNQDFYNLTHSGSGTLQIVTDDLDIDGAFLLSGGTFDMNDKNVSVAGNFTLENSTTFTPGAGTLTFDGTTTLEDKNETKQNLGAVRVD